MFEWVVLHLNPNFILKTDDDAYVDCARLVADLRQRCVERLGEACDSSFIRAGVGSHATVMPPTLLAWPAIR